jgi:hemerythrin-like domain-containing protein
MFTNRVSQTLHDEHGATVALMERLEQLIARHRRGGPPDASNRATIQLLSDLSTGVQAEVQRHFDFEESRLFPFLDAIGDEAIGAHLTDEHSAMRPLGIRVATLAREAVSTGFDQAKWTEFSRLGQELCERMLAHVQKEEMALLPLLEENMDSETEMRLFEEYAATA